MKSYDFAAFEVGFGLWNPLFWIGDPNLDNLSESQISDLYDQQVQSYAKWALQHIQAIWETPISFYSLRPRVGQNCQKCPTLGLSG